jgi:hypothetical protein
VEDERVEEEVWCGRKETRRCEARERA